jgi:hypothetical protein
MDDVRDAQQNVKGRFARRAAIAVLTIVVLLGLVGVFGMRSATVTSSAGGYDLTVKYGWISRAGLDTPWTVTVHHAGGFEGDVTLATTTDYFEMFETQGLTPAPTGETTGAGVTYLNFAAPPGDTLRVVYDAYIQPSSQHGYPAITRLIIGGQLITSVRYRTHLVP